MGNIIARQQITITDLNDGLAVNPNIYGYNNLLRTYDLAKTKEDEWVEIKGAAVHTPTGAAFYGAKGLYAMIKLNQDGYYRWHGKLLCSSDASKLNVRIFIADDDYEYCIWSKTIDEGVEYVVSGNCDEYIEPYTFVVKVDTNEYVSCQLSDLKIECSHSKINGDTPFYGLADDNIPQGQNLLLGTHDFASDVWTRLTQNITVVPNALEGNSAIRFESVEYSDIISQRVAVKAGVFYTFSCYVNYQTRVFLSKETGTFNGLSVVFSNYAQVNRITGNNFFVHLNSDTGTWGRACLTFYSNDDAYVTIKFNDKKTQIAMPKLEEGEKLTAWQLNEADRTASDIYYLDLDNDMDSLPCDSEGKVTENVNIVTRVRLYKGADCVKTGFTAYPVDNLYSVAATKKLEDGVLTCTWAFTKGMVVSTGKATASVGMTYNGNTYTALFTLNQIKSGAPGVSPTLYQLVLGSNAVKVDKYGVLTPQSIGVSVISKSGNKVTSASVVADLEVKYSIDGANETTGTTISGYTKDNKNIVVSLSQKGVEIDKETIPILLDGSDGNNGADGSHSNFFGYDCKITGVNGTSYHFHTNYGFLCIGYYTSSTNKHMAVLIDIPNTVEGRSYYVTGKLISPVAGTLYGSFGKEYQSTAATHGTQFKLKLTKGENDNGCLRIQMTPTRDTAYTGVFGVQYLKIEDAEGLSDATPYDGLAPDTIQMQQNLVTKSNSFASWDVKNGAVIASDTFLGNKFVQYTANSEWQEFADTDITLLANTVYTFSFWARGDYDSASKTYGVVSFGFMKDQYTNLRLCVYNQERYSLHNDANTKTSWLGVINYELTGQWKRYSMTVKTETATTVKLRFYHNSSSPANTTMYVSMPKLELGDKMTEWCLNESDKIGTSVKAQYSATDSGNGHDQFVSGDKYMRTSSDDGATWTPWIKIVGEKGDGADYTDFSFNISKSQTSYAAQDLADIDWTDSPKDVTPTYPYLWCRSIQKIWNNGSYTDGTTKYFVLTAKDGANGVQPNLFGYDSPLRNGDKGSVPMMHTPTGFVAVGTIDGRNGDTGVLFLNVDTEFPVGIYGISFRVKVKNISGLENGKFKIIATQENGTVINGSAYANNSNNCSTDKWYDIEYKFQSTATHIFYVYVQGTSNAKILVEVEDFKIERGEDTTVVCTPFNGLADDDIPQGQNLLLDTNNFSNNNWRGYTSCGITNVENALHGCMAARYNYGTNVDPTWGVNPFNQAVNVKPNTFYTISFYAKGKGYVNAHVSYGGNDGTARAFWWHIEQKAHYAEKAKYLSNGFDLESDWKLYKWTFYNDNLTSLNVIWQLSSVHSDETSYLLLAMPKLEEGEKATGWQANEADRKGDKGDSPLIGDLTNESDAIGCDKEGKLPSPKTISTSFSIYVGSSAQTLTDATANVTYGGSGKNWATVTKSGTAANVSVSIPAGTYTNNILVEISGTCAFGSAKKTLTITPLLGGNDGLPATVYQIQPSQDKLSFAKKSDGTLTPETQSLYFNHSVQTGDDIEIKEGTNVNNLYKDGGAKYNTFYRYKKADGTFKEWAWAKDLSSSGNILSVSSDTSYIGIECALSSATGYTFVADANIVDREFIPIIKDGIDGANGADGADGVQPNLYGYNNKLTCNGSIFHTAKGFVGINTASGRNGYVNVLYDSIGSYFPIGIYGVSCKVRVSNISGLADDNFKMNGTFQEGSCAQGSLSANGGNYCKLNTWYNLDFKYNLISSYFFYIYIEGPENGAKYIVEVIDLKIERGEDTVIACTKFDGLASDTIPSHQNLLLDTLRYSTTLWHTKAGSLETNAYQSVNAWRGTNKILAQSVSLVADGIYTLSFYAKKFSGSGITVRIGDRSVPLTWNIPTGNMVSNFRLSNDGQYYESLCESQSNGHSKCAITVTNDNATNKTLIFHYKISSESRYDFGYVRTDGYFNNASEAKISSLTTKTSGTASGEWSITVPQGVTTLYVGYVKDGIGDTGDDKFWFYLSEGNGNNSGSSDTSVCVLDDNPVMVYNDVISVFVPLTTDYVLHRVSFKMSGSSVEKELSFTANGEVAVCMPMLEIGDKSTGWQANEEDKKGDAAVTYQIDVRGVSFFRSTYLNAIANVRAYKCIGTQKEQLTGVAPCVLFYDGKTVRTASDYPEEDNDYEYQYDNEIDSAAKCLTIFIAPNADSTLADALHSISVPVVVSGSDGRAGAIARPCGQWQEGSKYVWNAYYRDIVIYNNDYYAVKREGSEVTTEPGNSNDWEKADNYKFVATDLLLADKAYINNLGVRDVEVIDESNKNVCVINKQDGVKVYNNTFEICWGNGMPMIKAGMDEDGKPMLLFYNESGNVLYNLGPNGIGSVTFVAQRWTAKQYVEVTSSSEIGSGTVKPQITKGTALILYKYNHPCTTNGGTVTTYYEPMEYSTSAKKPYSSNGKLIPPAEDRYFSDTKIALVEAYNSGQPTGYTGYVVNTNFVGDTSRINSGYPVLYYVIERYSNGLMTDNSRKVYFRQNGLHNTWWETDINGNILTTSVFKNLT